MEGSDTRTYFIYFRCFFTLNTPFKLRHLLKSSTEIVDTKKLKKSPALLPPPRLAPTAAGTMAVLSHWPVGASHLQRFGRVGGEQGAVVTRRARLQVVVAAVILQTRRVRGVTGESEAS